jgi:hypothetical protein
MAEIILIFFSFLLTFFSLLWNEWLSVKNPVDTGHVKFGLWKKCDKVHKREEVCTTLEDVPFEWYISIGCISCALLLQFVSFLLSLARVSCSGRVQRWEHVSTIVSCISVLSMCGTALTFPAGFHIDAIGGEPFKLPDNVDVDFVYWVFYGGMCCNLLSLIASCRMC